MSDGTRGGRERLNRESVVQAAVDFADERGITRLSMRTLADTLGVVPMALYKHVANKEDLLDGMVDLVVAEIEPLLDDDDWRRVVRHRILAARTVLLRHRWVRRVLETRTTRTAGILAYTDSFIGIFLQRGFSVDLTHHVMHALGSRMWGFTQELFDDPEPADASPATAPDGAAEAMMHAAALRYPNVMTIAMASAHDDDGVVGRGCDDQFEFEFALDLLLRGIGELHDQGWTSARSRSTG